MVLARRASGICAGARERNTRGPSPGDARSHTRFDLAPDKWSLDCSYDGLARNCAHTHVLVDHRACEPVRDGLVVEATHWRTPALRAREARLPRRNKSPAVPYTQTAAAPGKLVCDRHTDTRRGGLRRNADALKRPLGKRSSSRGTRARARTPRHPRRQAHRGDQPTHTNPAETIPPTTSRLRPKGHCPPSPSHIPQ